MAALSPAWLIDGVAVEKRAGIISLKTLRAAEAACTRCPLDKYATQVVPGEGPARARIMMMGEQPGEGPARARIMMVGEQPGDQDLRLGANPLAIRAH